MRLGWQIYATLGLAFVLVACGDNQIDSRPAATATATSTFTIAAAATATGTPTVVAEFTVGVTTFTPTAAAVTATTSATRVSTGTPAVATHTATPSLTPQLTVTAAPTALAPVALFSADKSNPLNPFPSDRLLDATGHVDVPPEYLYIDLPRTPEFETAYQYTNNVTNQLKSLDGFSTFAPLRLRFDRPMMVDNGVYPRGLLLLEYNNLEAAPHPITAAPYDPDLAIEVQPLVPLKSKTTYALVVTNALVDVDGYHAQPSPDFAMLLAGNGLSPELQGWRDKLDPVISYVGRNYDISREDLVLVDVFTTQTTTDDLIAIKNRLASGELVPGLPVFDRPLGNLETGIFEEGSPEYTDLVGHSTSSVVARVGVGYFESFDFRTRANGSFDPAKVHGPTIPGTNKVDFYMTIPKAAKPAGGYPLVLFGHGLGGSGRDVARIADVGRDAPLMAIGISALQHGRRGNVTNFFNLQNVATTREYFRQTVADFMQVIRMVKRAHDANIAPFNDVDTQRLYYLGGSLGGIMGTLFMAVEPDVKIGMLSVPGGGLPNILASHDIGMLLEPLLSLNVGIPADSQYFATFLHRFQRTSQWALDAADPINYAPHIIVSGEQLEGVPVKHILMHEGVVDSTVPNRTTDDLAMAMRLPDVKLTRGCMNAQGCNGIWRFVMTEYGFGELSGHPVTATVAQAGDQAFDYLLSDGTVITDASPD